jgi:hypothetical protein
VVQKQSRARSPTLTERRAVVGLPTAHFPACGEVGPNRPSHGTAGVLDGVGICGYSPIRGPSRRACGASNPRHAGLIGRALQRVISYLSMPRTGAKRQSTMKVRIAESVAVLRIRLGALPGRRPANARTLSVSEGWVEGRPPVAAYTGGGTGGRMAPDRLVNILRSACRPV